MTYALSYPHNNSITHNIFTFLANCTLLLANCTIKILNFSPLIIPTVPIKTFYFLPNTMQLFQLFLTISVPHTMPTVLTKTFFYDFTYVACFITIRLLAYLHRVNTHFFYLSWKWLKLVETLMSFFTHFFRNFFTHFFTIFFYKFLPPCCWHLRLQYWSLWSFLLILLSFYTFTMDFLTLNFGKLLHL